MSAAAATRTVLAAVSLLLVGVVSLVGTAGGAAKRDRVDPTPPGKPFVESATPSLVHVSWEPASDDVGVAGYHVYGDSGRATTATNRYIVSSLACGESSALAVVAFDRSGNRSPRVWSIVTTAACPDTTPPSTPSGFRQAATSETSVVLAWDASTDDVGVVGYGVYRELQRVTTTTEPTAALTGLECGSSYPYSIDAVDAAGNRSRFGAVFVNTAPCSDSRAPSAPAGLTVTARTQTSVSLAWNASTDDVGVTGYRVSVNGSPRADVAQTSATVSGLACGTAFAFSVSARDAAGNNSNASTVNASTTACSAPPPPPPPPPPPGDTTPPSTPTGLAVSNLTQTGLVLSWSQSSDNVGVAAYDLYLNGSKTSSVTATSATWSGLTCGTAYVLGVAARDAAGNSSPRAQVNATTSACSAPPPPPPPPPPPGDTTPPSAPTNMRVTSVTGTSVTLAWNASTDNTGVAGYRTYRNGVAGPTTTQLGATHSGLACNTAYAFEVEAYDAAGNRSAPASVVGATAPCADTQPPTVPTNVVATSRTSTSIAISWSAASDNVGVTGYGVYRGGTRVGTTGSTTWIFSGLSCNSNYTIGVDAQDAAGNRSTQAVVLLSTTACPDTTPPSAPAGLAASGVSQTGLTLTWNASTDNVGVIGYDVYRNGTKMATVTGTSHAQTGLACGTSYAFGVVARDAAGNSSSQAGINASTSACSAPPPPPPPPPPPSSSTLYGVHQDLVYFGGSSSTGRIQAARNIGARVSRSSFLWNSIERQKGVFDWSQTDSIVNQLRSAGIEPVFYPINAPSWANGSGDPVEIPQDPAAFDRFVEDYADFVRAAASRYRGVRWEVWNEPNEQYFWHPSPSNADQYTKLYNAARAAILDADPSAKVAVGGITGLVNGCCVPGRTFLQQMIDAGADIDYVGIHPYDGGAPDVDVSWDSNFTDIGRIREFLDANGESDAELWVTEYGWGGALSQSTIASYVTKSLEMLRTQYPYVTVVTYFFDIDTPDYPNFGLCDSSMQPKPAGIAFRDFVSRT